MKRLEIIVNQSIEADLFEAFRRRGAGSHFTKIPGAMGAGNSDPKMGDHIWPEENVILIIYCEDEEAAAITEAVEETKGRFPSEGLKLFTMNG
jgi:hypothetical protein